MCEGAIGLDWPSFDPLAFFVNTAMNLRFTCKECKFLDQLSDYQLFKENSASWSFDYFIQLI
jgi:hypothetical protein